MTYKGLNLNTSGALGHDQGYLITFYAEVQALLSATHTVVLVF